MRRARGPGAEAARLAPAWRRVAGCRQNNLDGRQINLNEIPLYILLKEKFDFNPEQNLDLIIS